MNSMNLPTGWLIRICVSRYFVKGFSRIGDFPGSEIGCFEPGNVFAGLPFSGDRAGILVEIT